MSLIRITALKDFRGTALSTTDVSTGAQLGGLSTGQLLYAALHLTSAYASTDRELAVAIQSATSSAFGSPVTRISMVLSTVAGSTWGTPIGNFSTDHSWFRASWTLSTTNSTNGAWKGHVWAGIK